MSRTGWVIGLVAVVAVMVVGFLLARGGYKSTTKRPAPTTSVPDSPQPASTPSGAQPIQGRHEAIVDSYDASANILYAKFTTPAYGNPVAITLTDKTQIFFFKKDTDKSYENATRNDLKTGVPIQLETDPFFNADNPSQKLTAQNVFLIK